MPHYTYLIVGGGMTADAAIGGISDVDRNGPVGLIGDEPHPPYDRPPLSKGLWKGKPWIASGARPTARG
jgi:NADPH-dependent 2,4-dienoyl-CoA reductase/sulfur reductase-like enzyme